MALWNRPLDPSSAKIIYLFDSGKPTTAGCDQTFSGRAEEEACMSWTWVQSDPTGRLLSHSATPTIQITFVCQVIEQKPEINETEGRRKYRTAIQIFILYIHVCGDKIHKLHVWHDKRETVCRRVVVNINSIMSRVKRLLFWCLSKQDTHSMSMYLFITEKPGNQLSLCIWFHQ